MRPIPPLESFGRRIMICGPSNAGKSTLAAALAAKLDVTPVYIDLLCHAPNTNWQLRPDDEFHRLHTEAVAGEGWAMEGNYFSLMPERVARATGAIMLGSGSLPSLFRYVRRTLFEPRRTGGLLGGQDRLSWWMINYILREQPRKRDRDLAYLRSTGLPLLVLDSMTETNRLYAAWDLSRGSE